MPRKAEGLTAAKVRTAKAGRYGDGAGLYLLVRGPEARFWLFRYTRERRMREMGLGSASGPSGVSLADARTKARKLYEVVRGGRDPLQERATERETKAAEDLGFHGKAAIHPKQISIINEAFTPSAEEVARARQILTVNQQGVGSVDHQMVDEAVARKARLVLERAGITTEK